MGIHYESFYDETDINGKYKFGICKYKKYIRIGSKRCEKCKHNKGHRYLNGWNHYCICSYKADKVSHVI